MAIPSSTAKIVLSGDLRGGEHFQTGFWMSGADPGGPENAQGWLATLGGIIASQMAGWQVALQTADAYRRLQAYFYTGGPTAAYSAEMGLSAAGTGTAGNLPVQICCVQTLRTGLTGRRHRGRMYLPSTGLGVGGLTGLFDSGAVADVVATTASVFTAINTDPLPLGTVCVMSARGSETHPVTFVDADLRPDVQRRRAGSQIKGTRVSADVAA